MIVILTIEAKLRIVESLTWVQLNQIWLNEMNPKGTIVTCRAIQVFYHDFNGKSKISINFNLNHSKISL